MRSTVLGNTFFDQLPEIATLPDLTALWHEQLEQVRAETMSVTEFVQGVETHIDAEIERIKNAKVTQIVPTGPKCPKCTEGGLIRRKGSNGFFWGCSNRGQCGKTFSDKRGKPVLTEKKKVAIVVSSEHNCPKCQKGLIRRAAKKKPKLKQNYWWGCSGFPTCDFRAFDNNGTPKI